MSESQKQTNFSTAFTAESQKERWLKYGANVALTIIVVLLLGGFLIYIAQRHNLRKDTTAGGDYSLKPQTIKLVENLPQKIKIVGLFTKARHEEQEKKVDDTDNPAIRYQQVSDLLQEYQQKSNGKIAVQMIDPITEPGRLDDLFNEVAKKYGNDVNKYNEVIKAYRGAVADIDKTSKEEIGAIGKLVEAVNKQGGVDRKIIITISEVASTVSEFPEILKAIQAKVNQQLELKVPNYTGAVDAIKSQLGELSEQAGSILTGYKELASDAKTPQPVKEFIVISQPHFEALKKSADGVLKMTENLGQLKQLDDLRQNKSGNTIAVMGDSDMKVLPTSALFPTDDARMVDPSEGKPRQRFAGEQQVTTALFTLTNPSKRKVVFMRSGMEPSALRLPMFTGQYATVADRLRELDFEILEKDISGQWAMQAMQMMQQGMPIPPEPRDEDLKGAIWVVLDSAIDPRAMMQNPAAGQLGAKLGEHLKNGGSALVIVDPNADNFSGAFKDWGIEVKSDYIMVHESVTSAGARSEDMVADALRRQPFFLLKKYGDHMLTRPIESLDGFFVPVVPVSTKSVAGIKNTSLLPIPNTPKPWAEHDISSVYEGKTVSFTPAKDDKPGDFDQGPFFGGAAAEDSKGGRLVVLGTGQFAFNGMVRMRDPQTHSVRFPANGELFVNSIFWISKMDTMIAISPTALDVPRVAPLSDGALGFWRIGVLIIGMPLLVLIAGAFVYMKRQN